MIDVTFPLANGAHILQILALVRRL